MSWVMIYSKARSNLRNSLREIQMIESFLSHCILHKQNSIQPSSAFSERTFKGGDRLVPSIEPQNSNGLTWLLSRLRAFLLRRRARTSSWADCRRRWRPRCHPRSRSRRSRGASFGLKDEVDSSSKSSNRSTVISYSLNSDVAGGGARGGSSENDLE